MKTRKKAAVTLIELLLVITIMAVVCGVSGVFIYRGIAARKFESEGNLILDKMKTAKHLAIQMDMETRLILKQEQGGVSWRIKLERPVEKSLKTLSGGKTVLKSIRSMRFQGKEEASVEVVFSRLGAVSSKGQLVLLSGKHPEFIIALEPSPHPLNAEDSRVSNFHIEEDLFSDEIFAP
jgi:Tfp pilus assembly protein FimT